MCLPLQDHTEIYELIPFSETAHQPQNCTSASPRSRQWANASWACFFHLGPGSLCSYFYQGWGGGISLEVSTQDPEHTNPYTRTYQISSGAREARGTHPLCSHLICCKEKTTALGDFWKTTILKHFLDYWHQTSLQAVGLCSRFRKRIWNASSNPCYSEFNISTNYLNIRFALNIFLQVIHHNKTSPSPPSNAESHLCHCTITKSIS